MNCSIDFTSSLTSLSIVLYCDSNRVHAGEYLFRRAAQYPILNDQSPTRKHRRWCLLGGEHAR